MFPDPHSVIRFPTSSSCSDSGPYFPSIWLQPWCPVLEPSIIPLTLDHLLDLSPQPPMLLPKPKLLALSYSLCSQNDSAGPDHTALCSGAQINDGHRNTLLNSGLFLWCNQRRQNAVTWIFLFISTQSNTAQTDEEPELMRFRLFQRFNLVICIMINLIYLYVPTSRLQYQTVHERLKTNNIQ